MINKIQTLDDVKAFAKQLIAEGLNFHPDDDFNDYVNLENNLPLYSNEEASIRNELMNKCFEVCELEGIDIYDLMLEVTLTETGMDALIPLPSMPYPVIN